MGYAVVLHGGAGDWRDCPAEEVFVSLRPAAEAAQELLAGNASALDAVVEAVRWLEDAPLFNAGTGSVLNLHGDIEMDAGVMDGSTRNAGGVGAIRRVRNPVLVAREVMRLTDHILLVGEGARQFARAAGFSDYDPETPERRARFESRRRRIDASEGDEKLAALHQLLGESPPEGSGTVGAVALDLQGRLAAATSTGGIMLKVPGRVGDSPIPGAGNYATRWAAASATGRGEQMLRHLTTRAVCDAVAAGSSAGDAVGRVLREMAGFNSREVGIIALDTAGRPGVGHLTPAMPHAYVAEGVEMQLAMQATVNVRKAWGVRRDPKPLT